MGKLGGAFVSNQQYLSTNAEQVEHDNARAAPLDDIYDLGPQVDRGCPEHERAVPPLDPCRSHNMVDAVHHVTLDSPCSLSADTHRACVQATSSQDGIRADPRGRLHDVRCSYLQQCAIRNARRCSSGHRLSWRRRPKQTRNHFPQMWGGCKGNGKNSRGSKGRDKGQHSRVPGVNSLQDGRAIFGVSNRQKGCFGGCGRVHVCQYVNCICTLLEAMRYPDNTCDSQLWIQKGTSQGTPVVFPRFCQPRHWGVYKLQATLWCTSSFLLIPPRVRRQSDERRGAQHSTCFAFLPCLRRNRLFNPAGRTCAAVWGHLLDQTRSKCQNNHGSLLPCTCNIHCVDHMVVDPFRKRHPTVRIPTQFVHSLCTRDRGVV